MLLGHIYMQFYNIVSSTTHIFVDFEICFIHAKDRTYIK